MKRNNFLLLALTSAILSTWTVNAYAVQVCYDSADSVCEEVTLVSPKDGSQIGYDSIEVTIKFGERSDELQEKINATTTGSDPVKYNIAIEEEGASTGCKSSQKELAKQNISFPYLGNKVNCNSTLNNDKKYKIYLQVNNKRVELGSFIYKDSTPWVTSGEPTHGIIYNKAMTSPPILYSALTSGSDTKCDFKLFSYDDTSSPQVEVSKYDDDPATTKWFWKEDGDKTPARLPDGRYLIYLNVSEAEENSLSVIPFFVDQTSPATKVQTPEASKSYAGLKELKGKIHAEGEESKGERYAKFEYTIKQGSSEVKTGDGYADEEGNFSLPLDSEITANGDYSLEYKATDQAGNSSSSSTIEFTIINPIIGVTSPAANSTQPKNTLSGTGTPGTELTITFGPKDGTQDEITPKPVVGADGTWSVELPTPDDGTYTYKVEGAYTADTDKKTASVTGGSGEFTVTLPTPTLDASLAGEATVNTDYEVKGTADPSTTVVITILDASGNIVGTAKEVTVGADGNWTTNVQFTSAATYKVKVSYKGINKSSEKEVVAKAAASDGTQPGNGTTQPGNGTTQPGNGTTQPGNGGQGGTQGGSGGSDSDSSDDGCGCATPGGSDVPSGGFLLALLGTIGWVARRRRK